MTHGRIGRAPRSMALRPDASNPDLRPDMRLTAHRWAILLAVFKP